LCCPLPLLLNSHLIEPWLSLNQVPPCFSPVACRCSRFCIVSVITLDLHKVKGHASTHFPHLRTSFVSSRFFPGCPVEFFPIGICCLVNTFFPTPNCFRRPSPPLPKTFLEIGRGSSDGSSLSSRIFSWWCGTLPCHVFPPFAPILFVLAFGIQVHALPLAFFICILCFPWLPRLIDHSSQNLFHSVGKTLLGTLSSSLWFFFFSRVLFSPSLVAEHYLADWLPPNFRLRGFPVLPSPPGVSPLNHILLFAFFQVTPETPPIRV